MLQFENNKLKEIASCSKCGKRARPKANINGATGWIFNLGACRCASPGDEVKSESEEGVKEKAIEEEPIPTEIDGKFEVLSVLGKGGMGTVYKVLNKETNSVMALKLIHSALSKDVAAVKRFEQEAQAVAQLDHPNLVAVYGHGKTKSGESYLLMDFIEGESLARVIDRDGALDEQRAIEIFSQICAALSHAHEQNLVHRDIKPANIILSKSDDGEEIARVVDFGIAKTLPSADRETRDLTQTGEVFGSPHYMSPEQCLGFMLDQRSDIYSLGCLMYEALNGKPPFAGSNTIQLVVKHINDAPKPFLAQFSSTNRMRGLQGITLKCLEKEQIDRWQTIDQVFDALTNVRLGKSAYNFRATKMNSSLVKAMLPIAFIVPGIITLFGIVFAVASSVSSDRPVHTPTHIQDFPILLILPIAFALLFQLPAIGLAKISTEGKVPKLNAWSINSMLFSGVIFWGLIPWAMSVVFFPGELLDAAKLGFSLPLIELFVLLGLFVSIIAMISTVVCAGGVVFNSGPKKVKPTSITPKVLLASTIIALLFPLVFVKQSAVVAALIASADSYLPAELSCGLANRLVHYAVSKDPNSPMVLEPSIHASSQTKNYSDMAKYCTALLKHPNMSEAKVERFNNSLAFALEKSGDYNSAIKIISKNIESHPDWYFPYMDRARCEMALKNFDAALNDYEELLGLYPRSSDAYYGRANAYWAKGLPEKAMESVNQRMELPGGNTPGGHVWKSYLFEKMGYIDPARKEDLSATNSLLNKKNEPIIHLIQALAFERLGQEQGVSEQIKQADFKELKLDRLNDEMSFLPEELQKQMKELLVKRGIFLRKE